MRLLAPFGTPRAIVNRLNAEWLKLAASSDAKDILGKAGFELLASTPRSLRGLPWIRDQALGRDPQVGEHRCNRKLAG